MKIVISEGFEGCSDRCMYLLDTEAVVDTEVRAELEDAVSGEFVAVYESLSDYAVWRPTDFRAEKILELCVL